MATTYQISLVGATSDKLKIVKKDQNSAGVTGSVAHFVSDASNFEVALVIKRSDSFGSLSTEIISIKKIGGSSIIAPRSEITEPIIPPGDTIEEVIDKMAHFVNGDTGIF